MEPQDLNPKTKLGRNHLHQVRSDEGPQYNSLLLGGPGLSPGQVGDVQPPPVAKEIPKVYPLVNLTQLLMLWKPWRIYRGLIYSHLTFT